MGKIVHNYVLEKKIGQGCFGKVYYGFNKITNQEVAAK